MDTHLTETEVAESKSKNGDVQNLPPRRGRIKLKILEGLAVAIGSMMGELGRKHTGTGGFLS